MQSKPTQKQWWAWERRAITLLNRNRVLMDEMMRVLGVDATEIDLADGVNEHMEYLVDVLHRQRVAKGMLK